MAARSGIGSDGGNDNWKEERGNESGKSEFEQQTMGAGEAVHCKGCNKNDKTKIKEAIVKFSFSWSVDGLVWAAGNRILFMKILANLITKPFLPPYTATFVRFVDMVISLSKALKLKCSEVLRARKKRVKDWHLQTFGCNYFVLKCLLHHLEALKKACLSEMKGSCKNLSAKTTTGAKTRPGGVTPP